MCTAKQGGSVINSRITYQNLVALLVDGLSCAGCVLGRNPCYQINVIVDECLTGQGELAAIGLQLSGRQFFISEDIMLQLPAFPALPGIPLPDRRCSYCHGF